MFTLKPLPYSFDALEPHIDAKTVEIHYSKHHQGYVNKLNELLAGLSEFLDLGNKEDGLEKLLQNIDKLPKELQTPVFNNAGQVYNHNLYWETLVPNQEAGEPTGQLASAIEQTFGDFASFQKQFSDLGITQFGSGWVWLSVDQDGKLILDKTSNADTPLVHGKTPLMTMDVWEHAYYLKYQNLRAKYIESFWNVVNWANIEQKLANVTKNS